MSVEGRRLELLDEASDGIAFDAHTTLFINDITLFVELAHHWLQEAFGLEIGPEFEAISGHGVVVSGFVFGGGGVHADGTIGLDELSELVADDVMVGLFGQVFPLLLE